MSNATLQFTSSGIPSVFFATTALDGSYSVLLPPDTYSIKLPSQTYIQPIAVAAFGHPIQTRTDPAFTISRQRELRADLVYDMCPVCQ